MTPYEKGDTQVRNSDVSQELPATRSQVEGTLRFGNPKSRGARLVGFAPKSTLRVAIPDLDSLGTSVLSQASSLSLTGGAMLVSTARQHPSLGKTSLRFHYDSTNADGKRLNILFGKRCGIYSLYDWELKPLTQFVDSENNGVVSIAMHGGHERVSLDAAFEDTLLGLRFIQADLMSRGIVFSQEYLPQDDKGFILGAGERNLLSPDSEIADALKILGSLLARAREGASYSVLTDAGVPFEISLDGNDLIVEGLPYYFFWEPGINNSVVPKRSLNDALKKAWPLIKRANPVVIESMEKSFRTVAMLRYLKQSASEDWSAFVAQVDQIAMEKIPTPSIVYAR